MTRSGRTLREFAELAKHAASASARRAALVRHRAFASYLRGSVRPPPGRLQLPAPGAVERLLIVRLDEIGDFVLTTPFLRAIRARYPRARISLVANASVEGLAASCPYVDELLPFVMRRRRPPFEQVGAYLEARRFARARLRGHSFDLAVIPRADIDNGCGLAMAYHAEVPIRVGYAEDAFPLRAVKNRGYSRFLTHVIERDELHEVPCALQVAAFLGAEAHDSRLELWPTSEERARASQMLVPYRSYGRGLIAFAPGGGHGRRRWPAQSFARLAATLVERTDADILLVGGRGEESLAAQVIAGSGEDPSRFLDVTGRVSLGEAAALLGGCALLIGNDSGPMHVAAAMGVPCVEISCHPAGGDPLGENSPARFSPWGVPSRVLQPQHAIAPCRTACTKPYAHCIASIPVHKVLEAVSDLLACADARSTNRTEVRLGPMSAV